MDASHQIQTAHALLARIERGESLAEAAAALGIPAGSSTKACWLGRVYTPGFCADVGAAVLTQLGTSHLEVAAVLPVEARADLLRRAASEGLSVRAFKAAVQETGATTSPHGLVTMGGATQLEGAAKALDMYAAWDDDRFARVLNGANGELIRRLARAGARLARRMNEEDAAA
jgi:hypothetical protein